MSLHLSAKPFRIAFLLLLALFWTAFPALAEPCRVGIEVSLVDASGSPAFAAAAEVSAARAVAGGFRVERVEKFEEGATRLRLELNGGGSYLIEVGFAGGADRLGQASTFLRSFERKLSCGGKDAAIAVEVPGSNSAKIAGRVDADFGAPAKLPRSTTGRKAGQMIDGGAGGGNALVGGGNPLVNPGETFLCAGDEFSDGITGSPWILSNLGDADQGAVAESGNRLRLTGDGTELYHGNDNTVFYHRQTSGDFRAEITINAWPDSNGGGLRKAGLMMRAGNGATDPRIMIEYVPLHPTYGRSALQFDYRGTDGIARELGSTPLGLPLPLRMAIDRRGDFFTVAFSTNNGGSWSIPAGGAGGKITLALPANLEVGPNVASYSATAATTVEFSRFELCGRNQQPLPEPPPTITCAPNRPLEILYLLDISGSMTLPYPGAASKIDAAKNAMAVLNDVLAAQAPTTEVALLAFNGKNDAAFNLNSSVRVLSNFTTDYDAVEAAAVNIKPSEIDPRTTTPTAIALSKTTDFLLANHDPATLPIVVLLTDTVPNIDLDGLGPNQYTFNEVQAISLYDGLGNFRPWGQVAWSGNFNPSTRTYDGEVLANSMFKIEAMKAALPDVLFFGVAIQGDGVASEVFREDLLEYGAFHTGGQVFSAADSTGLAAALVGIVNVLDCGGSVGDKVWLDEDADGVQDPLEPGIGGIPVEAWDASNTLAGSDVTDADGLYYIDGLTPGTFTVRIPAGSLAGLAQTYDLDGLLTANQATIGIAAHQDRTDVDFGYRQTAPEPGCRADAFDDGFVSFYWQPSSIGDDTAGSMSEAGGVFTIGSNGTDLYHGADNGFFAHQPMSGDFRAEIELKALPQDVGGQYRKAGLALRSSDAPEAARVMAVVVPGFPGGGPALQFDVRLSDGATPIELSSTVQNISLPVSLAIQRRGDLVEVFYSADGGTTWVKPLGAQGGDVLMPSLGDTVSIGVMAASYAAGQTFKASFDNFEVCQPDPEVPPPPPAECIPGQPLDATILLDMSGSMTWTYPGGASKFDAAKNAALELVAAIGSMNDGSRVALLTFTGKKEDPAFNLGSSVTVRSGLTADTAAVAAILEGLSIGGTSPHATTPLPIAYQTATNLLAAQGSPSHAPILVQIGDLLPNIDTAGRGPREYPLQQLFGIPLQEGGDWRAPGLVAWSGTYHGSTGTYTGEPLANAMTRIGSMKASVPGVRVFGAVTLGNGVDLGTSSLELAQYAAYYTGGAAVAGADPATVSDGVLQLLGAALCGQPGVATVGDRVWYDQDGDGVQDGGENGIGAATVRLLGAGDAVVSATTTDGSGAFHFTGVSPGSYTVEVDAGSLPAGLESPTRDADGIATAHRAAVTVGAYEVRLDLDFGYDLAPVAPPSPLAGCFNDDFEDGVLEGGWSAGFLGNASVGGVSEAGGTLQVAGIGQELFATDHGFLVWRTINNDEVRVEVDFLGADAGGSSPYEKTGLMVTSSLDAAAPRVTVQYQPSWPGPGGSLQFRYRATLGGDGGGTWASNVVNLPLPVRVAIVKDGDVYTAEYSTDGGAHWSRPSGGAHGEVTIDMGDVLLVGMSATSYDASAVLTGSYDNYELCAPE
jgi:Mg-chelatase subunit ChlD/regulation of enolase protein 1 (concanavalin A-like superfamily)